MRIAYISCEFPPDNGKGGIGTYVKQIACSMADLGADVHVFAGSPLRATTIFIDGYYVHWVNCSSGFEFREKVIPAFKFEHSVNAFDIMESPEIGGNAWLIKKLYPALPLVVRMHAPNYLVESLKKKYIPLTAKLRFVAGAIRRLKWDLGYWRKYDKQQDEDYQFTILADYITAPSAAMKNWVVQHWELPAEKIEIIPNIFEPSAALLNILVSLSPNFKRIVFFGRLNVLKGLVNATKAMKKIMMEFPEWQFKMIGDGGNGPYYGITMKEWICKELKLVLNRVEFIEGVNYEQIPAVIEPAEIVLLPSLFESFSYTCIEAMAAGKAVVGSNAGGMADLLEQEKSGLLIDPGNEKEIYDALKRLIKDNDFRVNISTAARAQVISNHNPAVTSGLFFNYYKKMVK